MFKNVSMIMFAVEDSCKWCCSTGTNTSCSPYANNLLPEGMPCLQGYCNAVVCCHWLLSIHRRHHRVLLGVHCALVASSLESFQSWAVLTASVNVRLWDLRSSWTAFMMGKGFTLGVSVTASHTTQNCRLYTVSQKNVPTL